MHMRGATVGIGHVACEDNVASVPADNGMRLRPVAFRAPRTRMSEAINGGAVDSNQHNFVLIKLPVLGRRCFELFVVVEEFGPRFPVVEKGNSGPRLGCAAPLADMPAQLVLQQACGGEAVSLPNLQSPSAWARVGKALQPRRVGPPGIDRVPAHIELI